MGCDIHAFREVRRDGQWQCLEATYQDNLGTAEEPRMVTHLHDLDIARDYWLFGLLAEGVRRDLPFSWPQRGLPDDASQEVKADNTLWDCDAHSHSWLGLVEIREKCVELMVQSGERVEYCCSVLGRFVDQLEWPEDVANEDCRIVFWFDN